MIRAVVFDFDGLILDTETPILRAWQEIFLSHGAELTLEEWIDCVGRPPGTFDPCDLLERHGSVVDRESLRADMRTRARLLIAGEEIRPGVREWIERAADLKLSLAVASSSGRAWVEEHLGRLEILNHFETLVCHEDVDAHKPDPEPYVLAAERLGARPSETIAVEDSSHGLRSARAAGLWCVAVPNPVTQQSVSGLGHLQLQNLTEMSLEDVIRKIAELDSKLKGE